MYGGTISGNNAKNIGGIMLTSGSFTMTGGEVSGNSATTSYGGIFGNGTIIVGGTAVITGNTANSKPYNLGLANNQFITLDTPSSGMSIGVTMQTPGVFTTNTADGYLSYFSSDDSTNSQITNIQWR